MVIAGWRKNFEVLADAGWRDCGNCFHSTRHWLVGERKEVRLYFVPVAKFGRKRHLVCDVCGHTTVVSDAEAGRIVQESITPAAEVDAGANSSPGADPAHDGFRFLLAAATGDTRMKEELTQKYEIEGIPAFHRTLASAAGRMAQVIIGDEAGPQGVATLLGNFGEKQADARVAADFVAAVHAGDDDRADQVLGSDGAGQMQALVPLAMMLSAVVAEAMSGSGESVEPIDVLDHYVRTTQH